MDLAMPRNKHPDKDIEAALIYAELNDWVITVSNGHGHAYGKMFCPANDKECRCGTFCITSIWRTPRSSGNHAKQIRRVVNNCTAQDSEG